MTTVGGTTALTRLKTRLDVFREKNDKKLQALRNEQQRFTNIRNEYGKKLREVSLILTGKSNSITTIELVSKWSLAYVFNINGYREKYNSCVALKKQFNKGSKNIDYRIGEVLRSRSMYLSSKEKKFGPILTKGEKTFIYNKAGNLVELEPSQKKQLLKKVIDAMSEEHMNLAVFGANVEVTAYLGADKEVHVKFKGKAAIPSGHYYFQCKGIREDRKYVVGLAKQLFPDEFQVNPSKGKETNADTRNTPSTSNYTYSNAMEEDENFNYAERRKYFDVESEYFKAATVVGGNAGHIWRLAP